MNTSKLNLSTSNTNLSKYACELQQGNKKHKDEFGNLLFEEVKRLVNSKKVNFADAAIDTDDLIMTIITRVLEEIAKYDKSIASFNTWLNAIIRNITINMYKQAKHNQKESLDEMSEKDEENGAWEPIDRNPGPEERILEREFLSDIKGSIMKFSSKQQRAFNLEDMGYSPKEIAIIMAEKPHNVSNWLYRTREKLKESIERDELSMDSYDRVA